MTWRFDPAVDADAFALLGYAAASEGIARTQRENRDGWWAHARRNRGFILDAAARVERPHLAVVLGAGKAYDLPLPELAARFERVLLIDIDAGAMAAAAAAAAPGARFELKALDLTGVTSHIARGIQSALAGTDPLGAFEALCASYRLEAPLRWFQERADLVVSSMVLSQLGLQPKLAAKRLYEKRFGPVPRGDEARWQIWNDLEARLQRDHVEALGAHGDLAVLTSDVAHHSGGESWSASSTGLEALVPASLEVRARSRWTWERVRGEVKTDVHALLLRARP